MNLLIELDPQKHVTLAPALIRFLEEYDQNEIDLEQHKHPSHNLRYDWNLELL